MQNLPQWLLLVFAAGLAAIMLAARAARSRRKTSEAQICPEP